MPFLSITLSGSELLGEHRVTLDRAYKFTKLKLSHVYHNIDSINFKDAKDKLQQSLLFIRLGGLADDSRKIINYVGSFSVMKAVNKNKRFSNVDYQPGFNTVEVNNVQTKTEQSGANVYESSVDVNHLLPVGATRLGTGELISRDIFKEIHSGSVLNWNGQMLFSLFYLNRTGKIELIDSNTQGIQTSSPGFHVTSFTMMFEYEEAD